MHSANIMLVSVIIPITSCATWRANSATGRLCVCVFIDLIPSENQWKQLQDMSTTENLDALKQKVASQNIDLASLRIKLIFDDCGGRFRLRSLGLFLLTIFFWIKSVYFTVVTKVRPNPSEGQTVTSKGQFYFIMRRGNGTKLIPNILNRSPNRKVSPK